MQIIDTKEKKEHTPGCACSICGSNYKSFSFKSGYICESCIGYIKDISYENSDPSRSTR